MKEGIAGKAIYRKNYIAYPWNVKGLDLRFVLASEKTMMSPRALGTQSFNTDALPRRSGNCIKRIRESPNESTS